eukprot:1933005-Rhodomonas_salina.1
MLIHITLLRSPSSVLSPSSSSSCSKTHPRPYPAPPLISSSPVSFPSRVLLGPAQPVQQNHGWPADTRPVGVRVACELCRHGKVCVCVAPGSQARTRSHGGVVERLLTARLGSTKPDDRTCKGDALPVIMGSPRTGKSTALVCECASFANMHSPGCVLSAFTVNTGMGVVIHPVPRVEIAL